MARLLRKLLAVLAFGVLAWLVGPPSASPYNRIAKGSVGIITWFAEQWRDNTVTTFWVTLVVVAVFWGGKILALMPRHFSKDPQRGYTAQQRIECFRRAGNRCEMETIWFTRCMGTAEHADHWLPHAKGGATNLGNAVAACARCNLAKSATVPSMWETARLERRRRRYFPDHSDFAAGLMYQPG